MVYFSTNSIFTIVLCLKLGSCYAYATNGNDPLKINYRMKRDIEQSNRPCAKVVLVILPEFCFVVKALFVICSSNCFLLDDKAQQRLTARFLYISYRNKIFCLYTFFFYDGHIL